MTTASPGGGMVGDQHDMKHTSMHDMMMSMTFNFNYKNVDILFPGITVNSVEGMICACIVMFILAILYEGLKVLRESLLSNHRCQEKAQQPPEYSPPTQMTSSSSNDQVLVVNQNSRFTKMFKSPHITQTFLHLIQVTVSYMLMLVVMSYNGYLAISIISGATVGYFLFGWNKTSVHDVNEHCH